MVSQNKMLRVTLIRSFYGRAKNHANCVRGLGIKKINHSVCIEDNASNRGMINKVSYLLRVEEVINEA